jgi:hydroxypyruvate reductase
MKASRSRREDARQVFLAAIHAADPTGAVRRSLQSGPRSGVLIAGEEVREPDTLRVVAFGKAAVPMARAAREVLPPGLLREPGLAVTHDEGLAEVPRFRVLPAGHPVPDARGAAAAAEVERYISGARPGEGLLLLVSGGGSALLPAPADGITLEDNGTTTRLLLECGADIGEVNTVRKHLSRLKGGRLASRARPARIESLLVSDVVGDDLSTIASGPTVPDPTTFGDARGVLERRGIGSRVPEAVRAHLEAGVQRRVGETPKPGDPLFERVSNRIIAGSSASLKAAESKARDLGYRARRHSDPITGEAREAGARLARCITKLPGRTPDSAGVLLLSAGETTVTVRGGGLGGRNQELALAFALEAERLGLRENWVLLSAGTDGRDGPTDAAGAIVDSGTLARGRRAGFDPERSLEDNDSYHFLDASGDLLRTGATGTNVADVQVVIVGPGIG